MCWGAAFAAAAMPRQRLQPQPAAAACSAACSAAAAAAVRAWLPQRLAGASKETTSLGSAARLHYYVLARCDAARSRVGLVVSSPASCCGQGSCGQLVLAGLALPFSFLLAPFTHAGS
jgi:hypothetical protein